MTSRKKKHEAIMARREERLRREAEHNALVLKKARQREQQRKERINQQKIEAARKAELKAALKKLRPKENS